MKRLHCTALVTFVLTLLTACEGGSQTANAPAVSLEFRRASTEPGEGLSAAPIGQSEEKVYLADEVILTHEDVTKVALIEDANGPEISVTFTNEAAAKFARYTAEHIGEPLAIIVDGRVVSAPMIRSRIAGGRAHIVGSFTDEEAQRIVDGLRAQ